MLARRIHSFVWGGLAAALFIALGISCKDIGSTIFWIVIGVMSFTFVSCLILGNGTVLSILEEINSWAFVSLPGLIFELSLDGIIWLLTVKLLFWILGLILGVICAILSVIVSVVVSVFVYPFSLYKNFKGIPQEYYN